MGDRPRAAVSAREGWLERDGARLHYLEWPGDAGRSVFALHGLSSNARFWSRVATHLDGRRFVALDQRSHGPSVRSREGDTLDTFLDDARHAIDRLALDRPVLAGHSWGAALALELALRHPDAASALAFIDGPAWPLADAMVWESFAARAQPPLPRYPDLASAIAAARLTHGPVWGDDLADFVRAGHVQDGDAVTLPLTHEARACILRDLFELRQDRAWPALKVDALAAFAERKSDVMLGRRGERWSASARSRRTYESSGTTRRTTSRSIGPARSRQTSRASDRARLADRHRRDLLRVAAVREEELVCADQHVGRD